MTEISVYFDKNSDVPDASELAMLTDLTERPTANQYRFHVTGFADSTGPKEYNQKLAKGRTNSVVNQLLTSGIEPQNILFDYEGEIIDEGAQDEAALAKNRRVDITVFNVGNIAENGFAGNYDESLFNRPIPTLKREQQTFMVDAKKGSQITTSSGTRIDIPPSAFMDAFGRPIEGEVEVKFEEYNDPFSIFLSGITMKVDENGLNQDLESAGMFNITASKDQRPVELRPDANINMEFVSASSENDFNFYFLDQNAGTWSNIGEAGLNQNANSETEASKYSEAVVAYLGQTSYLKYSRADSLTLEELFWDMEFIRGRPVESAFWYMRPGDLKGSKKFMKMWENSTNIRTRLLPKRKIGDDGNIYLKVETDYSGYNSEWSRFRGTVWEYDGPLTRKELKETIGSQHFQNLRLLVDDETGTVDIAVKNLDTIYHIPVKKFTKRNSTLDYMDRRGKEFSYAFQENELERLDRDFELKHRSYQRSLERQEKKRDKNVIRKNRDSLRDYNRSMKNAYRNARGLMSETELAMDLEEWKAYCASTSNEMEKERARQMKGDNVVRSLVIDRMGIYNCDRLLKRRDLQSVQPQFVLGDGSKVDHISTYVFENKTNAVIAYGSESIKVNPKKLKMILLVDREGKTYRLNESELIAMKKGDSIQEVMHVTQFDHSSESLDGLKDYLGLASN